MFMLFEIRELYTCHVCRNFEISLRRRGIVNGMHVHKNMWSAHVQKYNFLIGNDRPSYKACFLIDWICRLLLKKTPRQENGFAMNLIKG